MHNLDLILTLTGGLAAASILGYCSYRLGLSPIVGYLLAGFVVGPNTPGFVANKQLADQLSEIGVILLMFGVGLPPEPSMSILMQADADDACELLLDQKGDEHKP